MTLLPSNPNDGNTYVYVINSSESGYRLATEADLLPVANSYQEIVDTQSVKISEAFEILMLTLENSSVNVTSTLSGVTYPFGTDRTTRENIQGTILGIVSGLPVPNPMTWTPKGYVEPVELSHTDLITIGGTILNKVNAYYEVYFMHKANILMSSNLEYINSYDYTTGYT